MMGWHAIPGFDLFTVLFVILLATVLVRIFAGGFGTRYDSRGMHSHSGPRSALDIAKERYARGEISREEFLDITDDLSSVEDTYYPQKRKRGEQ